MAKSTTSQKKQNESRRSDKSKASENKNELKRTLPAFQKKSKRTAKPKDSVKMPQEEAPKSAKLEEGFDNTKKSSRSSFDAKSAKVKSAKANGAQRSSKVKKEKKVTEAFRVEYDPEAKVRIIPLGGLLEIGKNMTAVECGDDIVVIDCGLAFPDEEMPGVDLVIPDVTYLEANASKVRGIVLTHGHEDHIGAIPYVLRICRAR